jgi:hypothetical protein
VDRVAAEEWIRAHVTPRGAIETAHERPWSTVLRVPSADGICWFKACSSVQAFEPRLTANLFGRWPHLVPEVLGHDEQQACLLLADAGTEIGRVGNPPESWLAVLPRYAELQRGETEHVSGHLEHGVPDLRVEVLPERYDDLLRHDLPLESDEVDRLRAFAASFERLCTDVADDGIPASIQHDDLHMNNVYVKDGGMRVLDWGDSSIAHPFASLVCTFRFLEERNGLAPGDRWFARLRDVYVEPWGDDLNDTFALAMRVGAVAHAIAELRQRAALTGRERDDFDRDFATRLRRALAIAPHA